MSCQSVLRTADLSRSAPTGRLDLPGGVAQRGVQLLYRLLSRPAARAPQAAFERWYEESPQAALRASEGLFAAMQRAYGLPPQPGDFGRAIFALQTWFALVAKLAVRQQLALLTAAGAANPHSGSQWLRLLSEIEAGHFLHWNLGLALEPGLFGWPVACWNGQMAEVVQELAQALAQPSRRCRLEPQGQRPASGPADLLAGLYHRLVPRAVRHALGEYYTPGWLVGLVLDAAGYPQLGRRVLDPTCGTGAFLVEAIRRLRGHVGGGPAEPCSHVGSTSAPEILEAVAGLDANPLAVVLARLNLLVAAADLLPPGGPITLPVERADVVFDGRDAAPQYDYVVGNPPWIAWDNLPEAYRRTAQPLWQRYGLFSLSGRQARHGGSKKDLAMLVVYKAAERYLRRGGRLAMLVPQTVFQTQGAGDGFRRFRLGQKGQWLAVVEVHDLVAVRPFAAANWTAALVLEKGCATSYPVPYVRWVRTDAADSKRLVPRAPEATSGRSAETLPTCRDPIAGPQGCAIGPALRGSMLEAWPIDPQNPRSAWLLWPAAWSSQKTTHPVKDLIGPSDYQAHLGANTGGANGVYWMALVAGPEAEERLEAPGEPSACRGVDVHRGVPKTVRVRNLAGCGKRATPAGEHQIEAELLYPLLRWGDIERFAARPSAYLLLAQDPLRRSGIEQELLRARYPCAYSYLGGLRELLESRAAYRRYQARGPFYAMYDVGPYTLAPWKVVWRRMDRQIRAAVVGPWEDPVLGWRPVVPQETCVLVAVESEEEGDYVCAVLNSAVVGFLAQAHSVPGGKGFGSPGMLQYLNLRRFDPQRAEHRRLAALGRKARQASAPGTLDPRIAAEIDRLVGRLYGLDAIDVARMAEACAEDLRRV